MIGNETLFEEIAIALSGNGWCALPKAIPDQLAKGLCLQMRDFEANEYLEAGVGRGSAHIQNKRIRSDEIAWIDGKSPIEQSWLDWMAELQAYLNRRLYLGLFSFESHFAHYEPGAFYEKHVDAFRGQSNRVLTVVAYFNAGWQPEWGGELLIYSASGEELIQKVLPESGSLVIFLSEEFPHEVLPAKKDRYSIAGWFRVNTSTGTQIDPPR